MQNSFSSPSTLAEELLLNAVFRPTAGNERLVSDWASWEVSNNTHISVIIRGQKRKAEQITLPTEITKRTFYHLISKYRTSNEITPASALMFNCTLVVTILLLKLALPSTTGAHNSLVHLENLVLTSC